MTLNLSKGGTANLTQSGAASGVVKFGLGWVGKYGRSLDLDSYVAVLAADDEVIDFIYFNNKKGTGIKHSGDDQRGGKNGAPNETIEIDLSQLHPGAVKLIVGLFIWRGAENLGEVDSAFANVIDQKGNEVVRYDLEKGYETSKSLEVAHIERRYNDWTFVSVGQGVSDNANSTISRFTKGKKMGKAGGFGGMLRGLFG